VVFTFPTDHPVYPLRLTGVGATEPLALELFVLARDRARGPGLGTRFCARTDRGLGRSFPVEHPGLVELAGDATVVTVLAGTLTPEQLREDLAITLVPFVPEHPVRWTPGAAVRLAAALALGLGLLGHGAWHSWSRRRRARGRPVTSGHRWRARGLTWTAMLLALLLPPLLLPVAAVHTVTAGLHPEANRDRLASRLRWDVGEHRPADLETVARLAATRAGELLNPYSGEPMTVQDSPGNYTLQEQDGQVVLVTYDGRGAAEVHTLQPRRP
jgi:hypothetical protein